MGLMSDYHTLTPEELWERYCKAQEAEETQ